MAHFAKLDKDNNVLEVLVVNNNTLDSANEEASGITFLTELYGHNNWRQTSYSKSFRKNFATIGGSYNEAFNVFLPPKPFQSWKLNTNTLEWEAPTPRPNDIDGFGWSWFELNQEWVKFPKIPDTN
jgi:hypothetical protein